ncbi:MAG: hydrogenase small subunit [Syntrophobacteraceae bacterium]|nr:hydrogenase small subunit [Desulfobacteraceae bacterium]
MKVSRRNFIKYCIGSAAALGLDLSVVGALEKTLAAGGGPPVIWLAAANCTGCTVSLANRISSSHPTDVADLLINTVNLTYHPNLMGAAGSQAVQTLRNASKTSGSFILAVEGGVPTAFGGRACMLFTENGQDVTALSAIRDLASRAKAVLSVGTCASYGGIPGGAPNPTAVKSVQAATGKNTINIPGCPAHPDWIVWTIAQLLAGTIPALDSLRRPKALYGKAVHSECPRRNQPWASDIGIEGQCLQDLGCKGQNTYADCSTRKWNNAANWCVGANAICIGCTGNGFPDKVSPFYSTAGAYPPGHPSEGTTTHCSQCHGSGGQLPAGHPDTDGQSCTSCHGSGGAGSLPSDHPSIGSQSCTSCHSSSGQTLPPGHPATNGKSCSSCHGDDD